MSQYKKDLISSFVFLIIGAFVLISVPLTIDDPGVSVMGPRVFPYFIGASMVVISLALLASTLVRHRKDMEFNAEQFISAEAKRTAFKDERRAMLLAVVILAYSALFQTLGYFISTFIAVTVILVIFRVKKIWAYPVVYGAVLVVWAGFTYLLSVRLP